MRPGPAWLRLVDDAAIFPPGDAPLARRDVAAYAARRGRDGTPTWSAASCSATPTCRWSRGVDARRCRWWSPAAPASSPVRSGSCASDSGCASPGSRSRCATSTTWPATPAASSPRSTPRADGARRRVPGLRRAARARRRPPRWLAAADEVAAAELRLKFRTGGLDADGVPVRARRWRRWIDAALDRETPFKCTAGLHHAVRHTGRETGFEHHGFLNVLVATRMLLRRRAPSTRWPRCSSSATPRSCSRPPRSTRTSPARAAGSPRSAPARSPSRSTT